MANGSPAALGGAPVRRVPPDESVLTVDQLEVDYVGAWLEHAARSDVPVPTSADDAHAALMAAVGAEACAFASEFAAMHAPGTAATVVPASNGTRVITVALASVAALAREMGLREHHPGDEVIVPALTWTATAVAAAQRNLVPRFVDVDPDTLCITTEAVRAAITDRTVAILPVHLYGRMADVHGIREIAAPLGIAVGEDCAHAHGARWIDGSSAGMIGDFGTFSFQSSKTVSAGAQNGEGGALITRHAALAAQVASAIDCARPCGASAAILAGNERLPGLVAAFLRAQLHRFPAQNERRTSTFTALDKLARDLPGVAPLPPQHIVAVQPTYKWVFSVDLDEWPGMTVLQIAQALRAQLACPVGRLYEPLTASSLYKPLSDPALDLDDDHRRRLDPTGQEAPNAVHAYETMLALDHRAGADPDFPTAFATAVDRVRADAKRRALGRPTA